MSASSELPSFTTHDSMSTFSSWNHSTEANFTTTQRPPPPNTPRLTDILKLFPDFKMSLDLGLYGCAVQLAIGTVTNLLTLAVMTRRSMITSSTCFYFALLAVADLLVLYCSCLRRLLFVVNDSWDVYIQSHWSCLVMDFLNYLFYDMTSWILVAMTVDRYVAIRYPLRAAVICTVRNASLILGVILAICAAKNAHFFFTSVITINGNCGPVDEHRHFRDKVWPWLDAAFYSFVPFTLLLVFNVLIIHHHRLAMHQKHTLHASHSIAMSSVGRHGNFNQRLTVMLLTVSFTFMIMTAPKVILFSIRDNVFVFVTDRGVDFQEIARYSLVSAICSFLVWTNHIINFFLYCISGRRFRQEFLRMFSQCFRCKRHRQQIFASNPSQGQGQRNPRRGSNSSTLSDDVAPNPALPPVEQEDAISRVNRWATVTFNGNAAHKST